MSEFDIIIVGAGTAGCILAARLSEDHRRRVLLLEAGAFHRSMLLSIPAAETVLLGNPRYDWAFEAEPDPTLAGRRLRIPRGRLVGGSNIINGMIYVRGQPEDFDSWARGVATGWAHADVADTFRALEDWQGDTSGARGVGGPIRVELPRQNEQLCDIFVAAAEQTGFNRNEDYNAGVQDGFGLYQCTQSAGRRASVVDAYLKPALRRPNLKLLASAVVTRLEFEALRCVGITYRLGNTTQTARARGGVVLAAGVIKSPQLLELSGIGAPEVLSRTGIAVRHALPGVGENFHDHFAIRMRWRVLRPVTYNERLRGLSFLGELARYAWGRRGVLSLPIAIGFGFARSTPNEPTPDLQFHFAPASYRASGKRRLERQPGMTIGVYPLRPRSRGHVHVRSADPLKPPAISTRFLDDPDDLRRLLAGVRLARRIVSANAFDGYRGPELLPGAKLVNETDLTDFIRAEGDTSFHPVGTCRMGKDALAVVDSALKVHGLEALFIADASVMPSMVSGNTQAATMMIAERAAQLVDKAMRKSDLASALNVRSKA